MKRLWMYQLFVLFNVLIMGLTTKSICYSNTTFVSNNGNDSSGNGSMVKPYKTIQKGIDETASGDTVVVFDGIYTGEGNINLVFDIFGGSITVKSKDGPTNCIIDCENQSNSCGFYCSWVSPIIDGFTIINGGGKSTSSGCGGGIVCLYGNPTIQNNIIKNCSTNGILQVFPSLKSLIRNNIITNCTGYGLSADFPNFEANCNIFSYNGSGGVWAYEGSAILINNLIINNSGYGFANGALTKVAITNCTIAGNDDGIYFRCESKGPLTIVNTILFNKNNTCEILIKGYGGGTANISYSDVKGGKNSVTLDNPDDLILNWDESNINLDPQFDTENPDSTYFRLSDTSPCIGTGTSDGAPDKDIEGIARGIPPDMGAYENQNPTTPINTPFPVFDAALQGLICMYCATWEPDQKQYVFHTSNPSDPLSDMLITKWSGFFTQIYNTNGLDLLIPDLLSGSSKVSAVPIGETFDVKTNKYYLITPPVDPSPNNDINDNFGDDLGNGDYEKTWRVSKWHYNGGSGTGAYQRYVGPSTLPDLMKLLPGRGFWMLQVTGGTLPVDIVGTDVVTQNIDGTDYCVLKLPSNGTSTTHHMSGNPFRTSIKWKDCMVRIPMIGTQLAKIAAVSTEIEEWHLDLKLNTFDGEAMDTYNRAGLIMSKGINPQYFCANDLTPQGQYVRIALRDPINPDRLPYAYDYRSKGMSEYQWKIELSTSYDIIKTQFTIDNIMTVPEEYSVVLKDPDTGDEFQLTKDHSLDITLSSNHIKSYLLTVTETPMIPTDVAEAAPQQFGITGVYPNPFNPSTTVGFSLEKSGTVGIRVYNVNGQCVSTLVDEFMEAGVHTVQWNAADKAAGIYIVVFESQTKRDSKKITFIK